MTYTLTQVVAKSTDAGVVNNSLTLDGFIYLQKIFVERGRLETSFVY